VSEDDAVEFDFELRRYLLQRDAVIITRERLARLEGFENLAAARADRDALAEEVKQLRARAQEVLSIGSPIESDRLAQYRAVMFILTGRPVTNS